MTSRPSALEYVARNFHTCGDPMLEQLRREAVQEYEALQGELEELRERVGAKPTQPRQALAGGQLYRGVLIYTLPGGSALIFGENGQPYDCLNLAEAQAFVDACLELSGHLIGTLA